MDEYDSPLRSVGNTEQPSCLLWTHSCLEPTHLSFLYLSTFYNFPTSQGCTTIGCRGYRAAITRVDLAVNLTTNGFHHKDLWKIQRFVVYLVFVLQRYKIKNANYKVLSVKTLSLKCSHRTSDSLASTHINP